VTWHTTEIAPSQGIRWAVGTPEGRRGSTFKLWGNKKGDFYLAVRTLGGSIKTSLHRDGRCHTGFTAEYARAQAIHERHMVRWNVPLDRLVKAVQVAVPESALTAFPGNEKELMRWVRPPKAGNVAFVGIVILPAHEATQLGDRWPNPDGRVEPVGVATMGQRTAYILHWENTLVAGQLHGLELARTRARAIAERSIEQDGARLVVIGDMVDGSTRDQTLFDLAL
jgi:hypothetical protein